MKSFDALPRFVARPCPDTGYNPPDVSFDFRAAGGVVVLHAVDHLPGTCMGSITYSNGGQVKYAPLADDNFVARVSKWVGDDIDPSSQTLRNERLAKRDVARLLRLAVLPPGSRVTKRARRWTTLSAVGVGRAWKVRLSPDAVFAFEHSHRPHGSRWAGQDKAYRKGKVAAEDLSFSFPSLAHRVWTRDFEIMITPLADGWTSLGIRVSDVWVVARSPYEVVPSGVRTIEIRKGSLLAHRVTTARTIATIIRWFDALPLPPTDGPDACERKGAIPGNPPVERISFLDGSGKVLARATGFPYGVVSWACTPIGFSLPGHSFPALLGGQFLPRVERLLR